MAKSTDLTGKRFGMLTVLEKMPEHQDRYWVWRCRCDCGKEVLANTKRLNRGTVISCGCMPRSTARKGPRAEDLTGRRFGLLTVLRRVPNENGRTCWLCRCDCGNTHTATAQNLKAGKTASCGCLLHQKNVWITDITGERFGRLTALFPTEKRDAKGSVYWHCRCDCGTELDITQDGLAHGNYRSCGCLKKEIQMDITNQLHRIDGTCVEWLEKRKHRKDNTSGFRGVYCAGDGRFRVSIGFKKKRFYVGTYHTFDEAVAARLEAETLIHDQFVKAYYRWQDMAQSGTEKHPVPLVFEVKKQNGQFVVHTNMDMP